jgi:stress-induced morphogen
MIEDKEVFVQEQAFDVVAIYKVAAIHKMEGDGIGIHSHTNHSNIKVVKKAFEGKVIIKQALDY